MFPRTHRRYVCLLTSFIEFNLILKSIPPPGQLDPLRSAIELDLALGAVDCNVNFDRTPLLSPLCALPHLLTSPPPSAAAKEHFLYFNANCVVVITEYWSPNHLHHQ